MGVADKRSEDQKVANCDKNTTKRFSEVIKIRNERRWLEDKERRQKVEAERRHR